MPIKKVLIVEDDKPLSHALNLKLTNEGFDTTIARNGQECLDFMKDNDYDVVLLDMMMPVLDGFQVLSKLQDFKKKLPKILVLSNLSLREDESRIMSMGASDYIY